MAAPKLNLYYWNSLRWEAVTTNNDASAVIGLELEDSLGNGRIATITISNRAPDRSLVDDEDSRTGPYTDKFNLPNRGNGLTAVTVADLLFFL